MTKYQKPQYGEDTADKTHIEFSLYKLGLPKVKKTILLVVYFRGLTLIEASTCCLEFCFAVAVYM